jgi:hypothetical protein
MNSDTILMYIHVCHVLCSVVVMFACTLVRSQPYSRGVLGVKLELLQLTARDRVGRGNKMHAQGWGQNGAQFKPGTRP